MNRKELRELARKIAKQEIKLQKAKTAEEKRAAEQAIMELTGCVDNLDDVSRLDEMVLDILER